MRLLHVPLGSTPWREQEALKVTFGVVSHASRDNQQEPELRVAQVHAKTRQRMERVDLGW